MLLMSLSYPNPTPTPTLLLLAIPTLLMKRVFDPTSVTDLLTVSLQTEELILLKFLLMAFLSSSELLVFLRDLTVKKQSSVLLEIGLTLSHYSLPWLDWLVIRVF